MRNDNQIAYNTPTPISKLFAEALAAARCKDACSVESLLRRIEQARITTGEPHGHAELRLMQVLRARFGLNAGKRSEPQPTRRLVDAPNSPRPGISVVTCCMNRTENLLKALPTWLAHSRISEVVIVDWSSNVDVSDSLRQAGIRDSRVTVIRAIDEPRWVLSYAFNLGFRIAKHDLILKVDADITLKPDFFERNEIKERIFIAGNWEVAEKGQEHINGFFFVHRADLLRIKGFNEYITTYGWDDDDIYSRLQESAIQRVCVDTQSIYHIPHDDAQRLGGMTSGPENATTQLRGDTLFKIRSNRYIATVMPRWNGDRLFAPFEVFREAQGYIEVRRQKSAMPHLVNDDIRADAEYHAATELLSWRVGPTAYHLSRATLYRMLELKRLEEISQFDIDVALNGLYASDRIRRHSLYVCLDAVSRQELLDLAAQTIQGALGQANDVCVFVRGSSSARADDFIRRLTPPAVRLDFQARDSGLKRISELDEESLRAAVSEGSGAVLLINDRLLESMSARHSSMRRPIAPEIIKRRSRLYIDVQHGLGNRLRALGSAAAIARATERELVVLWQPDHHCECRLNDLFEYDGACIEDPAELPADLRRFNYMEIEPGATKGQSIELVAQTDVLVRSAYVLSHAASSWDAENQELRRLKPTAAVMKLVHDANVPAGCVGAHVRMEAGKNLDHHSYDSSANWSAESHQQIHFWRDKSHYSAFFRRLDELLMESPKTQIYLATDLPENYAVFQQRYGDLLHYLSRDRYDRSRDQLIYALADAILLSRCSRLLGSTWSSFSELAIRISTSLAAVEMSGKDF